MSWVKNIITTWKDATERKGSEKPYIMDELLKPSSWKILGWYFVGMIAVGVVITTIGNDHLSFWVLLILVGGFGVLGQALIKDKFITSRWTTPPISKECEESPRKEHSDENHGPQDDRQLS